MTPRVADIVAAAFVDRSYPMLDRLLVAVCALTALAVATLTLSVTMLRPPHVHYTASALLALIIVALSALIVATVMATAASTARSWRWLALSLGGAVLVAAGMLAFREAMSGPHFEGYALILGTLLVVQGALTIARGIRGAGRGACMRRV